jgi:hypothetical protein
MDRPPAFPEGSTPTLEPVSSKLEKFILYETVSYLYVVGCDKRQMEYRVIKLDRKVHVGGTATPRERSMRACSEWKEAVDTRLGGRCAVTGRGAFGRPLQGCWGGGSLLWRLGQYDIRWWHAV